MPDRSDQEQPASQPDAAVVAAAPARAPANILLVDDNPNKLLALETALAPLGENLVKAGSGADALRELLAREYAVIILDVSMPVMDGFETARTIRGRPRSASTPIIFASAINLGETDALRGYSLGAVDYILAPIIPEVLRAKVSVFVQLHRMTEEAKQRARQLEESQAQLRLAERMASLGTLAAGLGHDMGNLLLPIQTRLEDLDTSRVSHDVRDCLDTIGTAINYLSRLASGLRLLALGPGERSDDRHTEQSTDIASWWSEIQPLLRNAVPRGVELRWEASPELPPAAIAKHMLTQLVFNLVQNAGEVLRIQGKGTVTVGADASDGSVFVRVKDNGPGMSAEVRQRCLEPFFTTKSRTLSTGLGLAMVNGIVQRAGGSLEIDSTLGVGTTFTCRLPAATRGTASNLRTAKITVGDVRLQAVVSALLRIHGFSIEPPESSPCDAMVWVTDANETAERKTPNFLNCSDARRMVILGGKAPQGDEDPRITRLPGDFTVSQLRATLAQVARQRGHASAAGLPAPAPC